MWDCAQAERILSDIQVPPLVAKAFQTKMTVNNLADILVLTEPLLDMLFDSLQPSDFGARALGRSEPSSLGGLWSGSLIHALVVRALAGVSGDPSLAKAMAKRRIVVFIEEHRDSD